jgi:hypothetical protein
MTKSTIQLDDKYTRTDGKIYLSTLQAMTRLPMMQWRRDQAAGLNSECRIRAEILVVCGPGQGSRAVS